MTDQQLKIRIKLQQPKQSIEQLLPEPPEITAPRKEEEPPFDWFKISIALTILAGVLGMLIYFVFGGNGNENTANQPNQEEASATEVIISTEEIIAIPDDTQHSIEIEQSVDNEPDTFVQPDILDTRQHDLTTTPLKHPIPKPKPTVLIEKEIITELPIQFDPDLNDQPHVIRAQLSHGIYNREPIDSIDQIQLDQEDNKAIYFFSQINDLSGERVTVDWYHHDQLVTTTRLSIGADNWRTNASKLLTQNSLGSWRVVLSDQSGNQLAERAFTVSSGYEDHH